MGVHGVRALLEHDVVLRRQISSILCAASDRTARVAVPKVIDCGELRRVREVLFEERYALSRASLDFADQVEVGVVIETPAAILGIESLVQEADFLLVGLDSVQQYLLAADRDNPDLSGHFERLHPLVVRSLVRLVEAAEAAQKPVAVFGVTAAAPANLPFLLGAGLRNFSLAPVSLRPFIEALRDSDLEGARRAVDLACRVATPGEMDSLLGGYGE